MEANSSTLSNRRLLRAISLVVALAMLTGFLFIPTLKPVFASTCVQFGNTTGGTNTIYGLVTTGLSVGMTVTGSGIPAGSTITSIDTVYEIHISHNVELSEAVLLTFSPCPSAAVPEFPLGSFASIVLIAAALPLIW